MFLETHVLQIVKRYTKQIKKEIIIQYLHSGLSSKKTLHMWLPHAKTFYCYGTPFKSHTILCVWLVWNFANANFYILFVCAMIACLNKYWHVWVHASAITYHSLTYLFWHVYIFIYILTIYLKLQWKHRFLNNNLHYTKVYSYI